MKKVVAGASDSSLFSICSKKRKTRGKVNYRNSRNWNVKYLVQTNCLSIFSGLRMIGVQGLKMVNVLAW